MARVLMPGSAKSAAPGWFALLVFALAVYAFGLGGQYVPTNGDELVYAHIARLTAASGNWLPLASELHNMRNTKPPVLFWQAIMATDWGRNWSLFALRLPSLIYTLLITTAVWHTVRSMTHSARHALIAACVYLAFFSTFRYGRPYLTSAAETFWLDLPMFALLWFSTQRGQTRLAGLAPGNRLLDTLHLPLLLPLPWRFWLATGLAFGLGAAYKSFALIAPAAAALWCALMLSTRHVTWKWALHTSIRSGVSVLIGVGFFALWFAIDPDPAAVWNEFVVGENVGKMSDKQGYWHEAIYGGGSSLWAQLLAYVENAGLLAPVVLGLAGLGVRATFAAVKHRRGAPAGPNPLPAHTLILLAWLAVWLLVFSLPSQRSARYVIPAMPALAMLITLHWSQISRGWFLATEAFVAITLLVFARIAWVAHDLEIFSATEVSLVLGAVALTVCLLLIGLFKPAQTRACAVAACLLVYGTFNLVVEPLDGPQGRYGASAQSRLKQITSFGAAKLAVPSNFNAQYERFQFLLPGQTLAPFDFDLMLQPNAPLKTLAGLLTTHEAVIWVQTDAGQTQAPCLPACQVLASRWVVKERHRSGEITWANLWWPHRWLFNREWLLVRQPDQH